MEKHMTLMGIAWKILVVLIVSLAITAGIHYLLAPSLQITDDTHTLVIVAAAMVIAGFGLNLAAALGMMRAHKKGLLATGGLYAVFLNPMYTFQVFVTVPGLLLLFNSWIIMLSAVPLIIAFEVFKKEEEAYLHEKFADQYLDYRKKVLFKFL